MNKIRRSIAFLLSFVLSMSMLCCSVWATGPETLEAETIDISSFDVDWNITGYWGEEEWLECEIYTGKPIKPVPEVYDDEYDELTKGTDYTVSYSNNVEIGTATITITGQGKYSGTISHDFKIIKIPISKAEVTTSLVDEDDLFDEAVANYTGQEIKPALKIYDKYRHVYLKKGTDYTVEYSDNIEEGTASITVTGIGYYSGSKTVYFTIEKPSIDGFDFNIYLEDKDGNIEDNFSYYYTYYTGKPIAPAVIVYYDDYYLDYETKLKEGIDYSVSYSNNVDAGNAKIIVTGLGKYKGTETIILKILKYNNKITASDFVKTYSTAAQAFKIGATCKGGAKLSYKSNNKNVTVSSTGKVTIAKKFIGKATITITSAETSKYKKATKQITVTVNPTKTALSTAANVKGLKMKVTWKKNAVGTGYQVQYSTSSKFAKPKTVTIKKNSTVSTTISKLTKGKKYYVRIRTYKTVGTKNYYSGWSAAKYVTIKK